MQKNYWQLQDAKNKFSSLVDIARKKGPQIVTKHGRETVVIINIEEYRKLTRPKTSLVSFFKHSPLFGMELDPERDKGLPRKIEL